MCRKGDCQRAENEFLNVIKLGKINGNLDFSEKKGGELQVEMVKNRDKGAKRVRVQLLRQEIVKNAPQRSCCADLSD